MALGLTHEEISTCFDTVKKNLTKQDWFQDQNWLCSTHFFPEINAEGITFQVFKPHWFNQEHHGIHLESYLDFLPQRQKKSFVTLHLLHLPTLPGTTVKRKLLAQKVVDAIKPEIENWPGYVFRAGAYGQQPFALPLDGTHAEFTAKLSSEISRLALCVGPVVDQVLNDLLKQV